MLHPPNVFPDYYTLTCFSGFFYSPKKIGDEEPPEEETIDYSHERH